MTWTCSGPGVAGTPGRGSGCCERVSPGSCWPHVAWRGALPRAHSGRVCEAGAQGLQGPGCHSPRAGAPSCSLPRLLSGQLLRDAPLTTLLRSRLPVSVCPEALALPNCVRSCPTLFPVKVSRGQACGFCGWVPRVQTAAPGGLVTEAGAAPGAGGPGALGSEHHGGAGPLSPPPWTPPSPGAVPPGAPTTGPCVPGLLGPMPTATPTGAGPPALPAEGDRLVPGRHCQEGPCWRQVLGCSVCKWER